MADGIVTSGITASMAASLQKVLGRRVVVHRVEYKIKLPGAKLKFKTQIRYSLGIEGSYPPVFFNMTISEVKERMAMLLDLLRSGVINAGSPQSRGHSGPLLEDDSATALLAREAARPEDGASVVSVATDPDDRY